MTRIGPRRPGGPLRQVHDEDDGELEPFRRVDGHQVDGVERLDDGVRLVARGQRIDVIGDPRERRIAAILDAADQPPHLLEVLPRLQPPRAAKLVRVGRSPAGAAR